MQIEKRQQIMLSLFLWIGFLNFSFVQRVLFGNVYPYLFVFNLFIFNQL